MFERDILSELREWAKKDRRKPLIMRGARQTGKTTVVGMFSSEFDQFIFLNLERREERILFERDYPFSDLVISLFLYSGNKREGHRTLIFIDEIQNSPKAISLLRYFYEDTPDLYVIAAGSLLESGLDHKISFPVGRVEYLALYPCNFKEYLHANDQDQLKEILESDEIPAFAHDLLMSWYRKYATTGGMPEVVASYANHSDLTALQPIYDTLIQSYMEDV